MIRQNYNIYVFNAEGEIVATECYTNALSKWEVMLYGEFMVSKFNASGYELKAV